MNFFFPTGVKKKNCLSDNNGRAREALETIFHPLDVEYASKYSWNELIDNFAVNTFRLCPAFATYVQQCDYMTLKLTTVCVGAEC